MLCADGTVLRRQKRWLYDGAAFEHLALTVGVRGSGLAAAVAIARTTVANTNAAFVALVRIALDAAEGRPSRLYGGAKLWVVVVDALCTLLEEAQAVGRFLRRSVEGGFAGTGRTASAQSKRPVGQLRGCTRDNKALLV